VSKPEFIPFAQPDITAAEIKAVTEAMESGWITTAARTKKFEAEFAARVSATHGVAVNSCTAAMHLGLEALGVEPGDEVIVPTLTFAATAEVVRYMGAKPVLVDVRAGDQNMDPAAAEAAITDKTRVIIPVHFGGQACDMDAIMDLARAKGIKVLEDAAHAFPCSHNGRPVGSIGDITAFSFYATKTITTGEGGMATTNNDQWAERMRVMSLHGISKDAWKRYTAEGSWFYEIVAPGFKYNMTDIAAAMGLVQLNRADEMMVRRREIAHTLQAELASVDALETLDVNDPEAHAWHLFVVRLRDGLLNIDRAAFIEALRELGVGASVHFIPLHIHPYYRETYGYQPGDLPVAQGCYERSISLPIYSKMDNDQVARVAQAVADICAAHRR
jgi:dTDP-4-amino-4,6-dideoxygalactose transaminase